MVISVFGVSMAGHKTECKPQNRTVRIVTNQTCHAIQALNHNEVEQPEWLSSPEHLWCQQQAVNDATRIVNYSISKNK